MEIRTNFSKFNSIKPHLHLTTDLLQAKFNKLQQETSILTNDPVRYNKARNLLVYTSKNPMLLNQRTNAENLNGAALDKKGKEIFCRQIAFEQLKYHKDYAQTIFASTILMAQHLPFQNNCYDNERIPFRADSYHCCILNNLGESLYAIAENMPQPSIKSMLFGSATHMMALTIKYKADGTVVVKFFDPNFTHTHKRCLCGNMAALKNLRLNDLMLLEDQNYYFDNSQGGILAVYDDLNKLKPEAKANSLQMSAKVFNHLKWECLLYFALNYNDPELIARCIKNLLLTDLADKLITKKLLATGNDGIPGLYMALQTGHHQAVSSYLDGLKFLNLPQQQLTNLLMAALTKSNGTSGLYMALQTGHHQVIRSYLEGLKALNLPQQQLTNLLLDTRSDGTSGLYMALKKGHHQAVRSYLEGLKALNLPQQLLSKLLIVTNKHGTSGLYIALQNEHHQAVRSYLAGLKFLNLPEKPLIKLLKATCKYGIPWLYMALHGGYHEAVGSYLAGLKFLNLPQQQLTKLLLVTTNKDGTSGLAIALQNGHHQALGSYLAGLKSLNLPQPQLTKLLLATNQDDTLELSAALQNWQHQALCSYVSGLKLMTLAQNTLLQTLATNGYVGISWLSLTLQYESQHPAIKTYIDSCCDFCHNINLNEFVAQTPVTDPTIHGWLIFLTKPGSVELLQQNLPQWRKLLELVLRSAASFLQYPEKLILEPDIIKILKLHTHINYVAAMQNSLAKLKALLSVNPAEF